MKPESDLHRRYPDLLGAREAMKRAAENARKLAEQTGTKLCLANRSQRSKPGIVTGR